MDHLEMDHLETDYAALTTGAALQLRPDGGVLVLSDADRVDFLQRMTTNNIAALRTGQACVTVLTSPTAKIVQVFTVLARAEDLLLLPAPGATAALARNLRGQIFFMDKVKVGDTTAQYTRARLLGPQAETTLGKLLDGTTAPGDGAWLEHAGIIVLGQPGYDVPGYELLIPNQEQDAVLGRLAAAGAFVLTGDAAYTARRIELVRPLPGAELVGEYNPLEAGLAWACAENKGCYTGQEIIARQVTYEKVTRLLVQLQSDVLLPPGATLHVDGRPAGTVTSSAWSPAQQSYLALGIVKRTASEPGTRLSTAEGAQAVVTAAMGS